jgi:hypothetical protein
LDGQVARPHPKLEALQKQFVCVRLVQMNPLDLKLFQFDYDQTFAAFFFNADGTLYGRFGTRAGNGPRSTTHVSLPAFERTLERALEIHRGYPGNRGELIGKQGREPEYRTVQQIPELKTRPARVSTNRECVHCHQVREERLRRRWLVRTLQSDDLWVYPLPENVGIKLLVDDGLTVTEVTADSPAARAGLREGDRLVTLGGQRLLSQADIQWVLDHAANDSRLPMTWERDGDSRAAELPLKGDWKKTDLAWRASSGPGLRWGVWSTPLPATGRGELGIPNGRMALQVKNLFGPRANPVIQAGLKVGDVIFAVDDRTDLLEEGEFLAYLRLNYSPGERVRLSVRRRAETVQISVPMW